MNTRKKNVLVNANLISIKTHNIGIMIHLILTIIILIDYKTSGRYTCPISGATISECHEALK